MIVARRIADEFSRSALVQAGTKRFALALPDHDLPTRRMTMGRYMLLWLLGVPIPILLLVWAFGGLG